jgi:pentatricopeptide repeat protein
VTVDRAKILEAAHKHLAKGAYDKAIAEFQRLVKADPSDVRTWLKIGDLYAKKGSIEEAINAYARVADQYSKQGFHLKAVAVYKQILKLDPNRLNAQLKIAEAYESLQLVKDALETYEALATNYSQSGRIDEALAMLAKMVELDPENVPIRIKYAEALSKANKTKEAADAFEAGANLLKAQGRIDDWIKVAERLLFHRPDDVGVARELSQRYLERQDAKRALAKLQICFKADPKDIATLEMLAEAFQQLGQLPKTISVYREIARIHQEAKRPEAHARVLKKILELDPGDAEARLALAAYAQPKAAPAPAPTPALRSIGAQPGAVFGGPARRPVPASAPAPQIEPEPEPEEEIEEILEEIDEPEALSDHAHAAAAAGEEPVESAPGDDEEVIIVENEEPTASETVEAAEAPREPTPPPAHPPSAAPAARESALPPEIARDAQIAKLLTECDVFLRYGLKQKVVDQLRRVLDIDPTHVEARERLKDVLIELGDIEGAIAQLLVLADLFFEHTAIAVLYLKQILDIDPLHREANARLALLTGEAGPGILTTPENSAAEAAAVFDHRTVDKPATSVDDGVSFVHDEAPATAPGPRTAPPPAPTSSRPPDVPPETLAGRLPPRAAVPQLSGELDALGDPLAPISPEEFERAPLRSSDPGAHQAPVTGRTSMPPSEVEELLDEADFFAAQGLLAEAMTMLRDALSAHPRNRLIADKLAEIEDIAAQHRSQPRSAAPKEDRSFELAEKLAQDLGESETTSVAEGSGALNVEEVFAQFKKGVEQQVGLEDTETHFDLGIAYQEMGLFEDAIAEFELCLANPQKQCIAHTMIGLCHLKQGNVVSAIAQFKKALYAEIKTDREELGLYYELGRAYEMLRDPKEALYYYDKVRKRDPGFRDVGNRIQALTRPATAAVPPAPSISGDDIDAAFDELMNGRDH